MSIVNLRSFRSKVRRHRTAYRRFLSRIQKNAPRQLDQLAEKVDKEVWAEIDCISCANCCKTMSPTYSQKDIRRISAYLGMSVKEFKKEWLIKEKSSGDWLNKTAPCQFLDLKTNMCGIYDVRPSDCSGFPHLPKKKMVEYIHVHKQNLEFCPATFRMVEKMMVLLNDRERLSEAIKVR